MAGSGERQNWLFKPLSAITMLLPSYKAAGSPGALTKRERGCRPLSALLRTH